MMKKRKFFALTAIILLSLIGCKTTTERKDDLYLIINELIKQEYNDIGIVVLELNKVCINSATQVDSSGISSEMIPPPPPPPGVMTCYSKGMFESFEFRKLLNSNESKFMYNQIDSSKSFILDSARIEKRTMLYSRLNEYARRYGIDSTYSMLRKKYNSSKFIQISYPLFSEDGKKAIITIDYHCGHLCGGGETYLLEKENNIWKIVESIGNWVS